MKRITTETVAEALLGFWSHTGFPDRVTSDNGPQFVSNLMEEVLRNFGIKHIRASPYHAQANGICENFNKSLKLMLKRLCIEKVRDWDKYIDPCLFAYRETPHSSTGYSPFELTQGRNPAGPMKLLKQLWTKEGVEPDLRTTYQYVLDLRSKIQDTCEIARSELKRVQVQNKKYFDKRAKHRSLALGDLALLLLPMETNKMELHWKGPYRVVQVIGDYDYKIELEGGKLKTFHINMLKKYVVREPPNGPGELALEVPEAQIGEQLSVIASCLAEERDEHELSVPDSRMFVHYNARQKETYRDVEVNPDLQESQQQQIWELLEEFQDIFSDVPKITNLGEHEIKLRSTDLVQQKAYPVPAHLRQVLDEELDTMLEMGVISPSDTLYSSPLVMVKKADNTPRVCVDFRRLNQLCALDPEAPYSPDDIFTQLGGCRIYSKFDLAKGYYQIRLSEKSRELTGFATHRGKFAFEVLPFGLSSAPMTFNRIMRKLLERAKGLHHYLDDVLAHTESWTEHLATLRDFFIRVREANLSIRPSKCQVGYNKIEFLGQVVVEDALTPNTTNLEKILNASRPNTKTRVKSFLGLTGFYQNFIPRYSSITAPLTDLLRKNLPDKVRWGDSQESAFVTLKECLLKGPILKLPMLEREFILRTDASDRAVGAVLLQDHDGRLHPVAYASKKLSERERRYAISQKECLAVIYGVQRFHKYLYAKKFVLETDHKPLEILSGKPSSCPRLMRWALALQAYTFQTRVIAGSENLGADFLSRHIEIDPDENPAFSKSS